MSVTISSPTDRTNLKNMLTEMTHCLARMDAERDAKKEIALAVKEKFELAPKLVNKLASAMARPAISACSTKRPVPSFTKR